MIIDKPKSILDATDPLDYQKTVLDYLQLYIRLDAEDRDRVLNYIWICFDVSHNKNKRKQVRDSIKKDHGQKIIRFPSDSKHSE